MKKLERDHEKEMKKLERDHVKEMKELDIKGRVAEQEAKVQVYEVYRCYLKGSFNLLIKVLKLEFEERMRQNKRNGSDNFF